MAPERALTASKPIGCSRRRARICRSAS